MAAHPASVAVVTGAGSGIGRAVALTLLKNGFNVVLAGRKREPLQETAAQASAPGQPLVGPTNIAALDEVHQLFERTTRAFGRLDLLFNNAGVNVPDVSLEDLTYEQWKSVVDVNLTGTFLCTQAAFRIMKNQVPRGGRIINNGSVSSHVPRPDSIPYTATKHAITGLTRSTALDGRPYDIACGQIDIGNARTELAARMERGVAQANGSVAIEPMLDLQHVAAAVLYMASLPLEANVQFITVMPSKMPFIGRG